MMKFWQVKQEKTPDVTVLELLLTGLCCRKGLRIRRIN